MFLFKILFFGNSFILWRCNSHTIHIICLFKVWDSAVFVIYTEFCHDHHHQSESISRPTPVSSRSPAPAPAPGPRPPVSCVCGVACSGLLLEMGSYDMWSFVSLPHVFRVVPCTSRGLGSRSFSWPNTIHVMETVRFVYLSTSGGHTLFLLWGC